MNIKKRNFVSSMIACVIVVSSFTGARIFRSASAYEQEEVISQLIVQNENEMTSTSSSLDKPIYEFDDATYIFAVKYDWYAQGGDRVAFSMYPNRAFSICGDSPHYSQICFPDPTYANTPIPNVCSVHFGYYFKSYNTSTGNFSDSYSTCEEVISVTEANGYEHSQAIYGHQCALNPKDCYVTHFDSIPTKWDVEGRNLWSHGGGDVLVATIRYKDKVFNTKTSIPWLGWSTSSIVLDGVTFSIRTGPNKCSVICDKNDLSDSDFDFAFRAVSDSDYVLKAFVFSSN